MFRSTDIVATPFGFAGEYTDAETGFVYLRARHYDPATGQFISRDPITAITQEPYGYVGGNPVNATDPLGLAPWDVLSGAWDWVKENPGAAATGLGVLACIASTLGVCAAAAAGAFVVRTGEAGTDNGYRDSLGAILVDGGLTFATFGLVSAPAWYGLVKGGQNVVIPGVLAAGERGVMAGASWWQQALGRLLAATPDFAGLVGGWLARVRC